MMVSLTMSVPISIQHRCKKSGSDVQFCRRSPYLDYRQGLLTVPAVQRDNLMFSSGQKNQYPFFSNFTRKYRGNNDHPEVEIVSRDCIKPAVPTPEHLTTYEVSIIDQGIPHFYPAFVYFYLNDHQNDAKLNNVNDLTLKRIQVLKQSLSKTLTRFYPLAGKVKDYRHIDCIDDGVYCVEAKVNQSVSDYLSEPGNKSVEPLFPFGSNPMESFSQTYVVMIQLTTFSCGGISIGLCASHKIMDAYSFATFLKAWAATARASPDDIFPRFISPSIFPSTPTLPESVLAFPLSLYLKQGKSSTKRFVFSASSLMQLKKRGGASRVLGVSGLIWKCAIKSLKARSAIKSSALTMAVDLRGRSLPPLPLYTMGNVVWASQATSLCWEGADFGLDASVQCIKNSVDKLNSEFVESMKGDEGLHKMVEYLNEVKQFSCDENAEYMLITSMCNSGIYEADFGWGKSLWFTCAHPKSADPNIPQVTNFVQLMDTRNGNGIEAWVTLSDEDMGIFEQDPELLQVASVDPSPVK